MYKKTSKSWIKHLDFVILDILFLAIVYYAVFFIWYHGDIGAQRESAFITLGIVIIVVYFIVSVAGNAYKDVLQRNKWNETVKAFIQIVISYGMGIVYLFLVHRSDDSSRLFVGITALVSFIIITFARLIWKNIIRARLKNNPKLPHLLIISESDRIDKCISGIVNKRFNAFYVMGIVLADEDRKGETVGEFPIVCGYDKVSDYIVHEIVDEVLLDIEDNDKVRNITRFCLETGLVVHINCSGIVSECPNIISEEFGGHMVLTTSNNVITAGQLFVKRLVDIVAGFFGVLIMLLLYVIVAPCIKSKDPGPVFFHQTRIGKNGRKFELYKFRSMYMDAEARKAELMAQNEMQGFMFKMENDPRIIPGIGEKIRKLSIDEFPQFWNILKGDMSLIGIRPPTVAEYEQYEAHHKARLSFKPGLTGLWQVSGRNSITDFEEVVKLDTEYIKNWSLKEDIKIFFKTIDVVLTKKGSM